VSIHIAPVVTGVSFTPSRDLDRQAGLLGWISCDIDGFHFDGLTLGRSNHGRLHVAYPSRRSSGGHRYAVARPNNTALAAAIEEQVFAALRSGGLLP